MLATRVSFMNEMAAFCDAIGADVEMVRRVVGADRRVGDRFLFPGVGYGGSCFPKDTRALYRCAEEHAVGLGIVRAAMACNDMQTTVLVRKFIKHFQGDTEGRRVAMWGLAFKPGTDDVREAPALDMVGALTGLGVTVVGHDPQGRANAEAELERRGHFDFSTAADPYQAAEGADALFVVTEWPMYRSPDFRRLQQVMAEAVVFDGRNLYDPAAMVSLGMVHYGVGRGRR